MPRPAPCAAAEAEQLPQGFRTQTFARTLQAFAHRGFADAEQGRDVPSVLAFAIEQQQDFATVGRQLVHRAHEDVRVLVRDQRFGDAGGIARNAGNEFVPMILRAFAIARRTDAVDRAVACDLTQPRQKTRWTFHLAQALPREQEDFCAMSSLSCTSALAARAMLGDEPLRCRDEPRERGAVAAAGGVEVTVHRVEFVDCHRGAR